MSWLCPCVKSNQQCEAGTHREDSKNNEKDSACTQVPKDAQQNQSDLGTSNLQGGNAKLEEGIASKKVMCDEEDPLRANQWPHIRVNVPHVPSAKKASSHWAMMKEHADSIFGGVYRRVAADFDEPPVRAALGLVFAAAAIVFAAFLAPVTLFKAVLVAIAWLTGPTAPIIRCRKPSGC